MKVMDNKLFSVTPQEGKLQPGECRTVSFTYRHTMSGTDRLPVLLKLARGREVLVSLYDGWYKQTPCFTKVCWRERSIGKFI